MLVFGLTFGRQTKSILGSGDLKTALSGVASTWAITTERGKFQAPPTAVSQVITLGISRTNNMTYLSVNLQLREFMRYLQLFFLPNFWQMRVTAGRDTLQTPEVGGVVLRGLGWVVTQSDCLSRSAIPNLGTAEKFCCTLWMFKLLHWLLKSERLVALKSQLMILLTPSLRVSNSWLKT